MTIPPVSTDLNATLKVRNVFFVLLGVAVLLIKQHYVGPAGEIVHAYAGNLSVSFAVYFIFANLEFPQRFKAVLTAACALTVVELFEAFDGFGIMSNTYDPIDFLVNAVGIVMAFLLDMKLSGRLANKVKTQAPSRKQE